VSTPARKFVEQPARRPAPAPQRRGVPTTPARAHPPRTPAARPHHPTPPQLRRRARRGPPLRFWVFTAVAVTGMVVGLVSLSAMLVQTSFRVGTLQQQIVTLTDAHEVLAQQVAELSSPPRVQAWARRKGMVVPERVVVLRVPPTPGAGA